MTIREKITLNPKPQVLKNKESNRQLSLSNITSGFIIPKKGTLQVYYASAQRLNSDVPFTARIKVHRLRSDTVLTDQVINRFYHRYSFYNSDCSPVINQYNYDQQGLPTVLQPFSAMSVQKGDTVQFYYLTDLDPIEGTIDTLGINSTDTTIYGWDVRFGTWNTCRATWADMINIFIGIADTILKFTVPASDSLYPTYPGHNDAISKKNYIDLTLKVQFGDSLMKNVWVKVDSTVLVDSGGHSHNHNRPMGRYIVAKIPPTPGYDTVQTFTRKTDSTGVIRFTFLASQFGGIERIKAKLLSDSTSFDTLRLITKVPSLALLPDRPSYVKVGGTCNHRGPRDDSSYQACRTPDNNHWGSSVLLNGIVAIGDSFIVLYPGFRLRINDMSLKYGGGFDVNGNWELDIIDNHSGHREGKNADVSFTVINPSGISVPITPKQQRNLLGLITRIYGYPYPHSDHYNLQ